MSDRDLFLLLIKELHRHSYVGLQNLGPNDSHASVAMIFVVRKQAHSVEFRELFEDLSHSKRLNFTEAPEDLITPYKTLKVLMQLLQPAERVQDALQLVFIQRAANEKDVHSGQIALPGGHVDLELGENDFQAAVRETQEEVGFNMQEDIATLYLGKYPKQFFTRRKNSGQNLYLSVHLFLVRDEPIFHAQPQEVQDIALVNLNHFIDVRAENFIYKKTVFWPFIYKQMLPQLLQKKYEETSKLVKDCEMPAVNIGMREPLWGLTLHVLIYMLTAIDVAYRNQKTLKKADLKRMRQLIVFSNKSKVNFKSFSLIGVLMKQLNSILLRKYRHQPFTYTRDKSIVIQYQNYDDELAQSDQHDIERMMLTTVIGAILIGQMQQPKL